MLIPIHEDHSKPKSSKMFWTSDADMSNSTATSIGFLPDENSHNAFVSTDFYSKAFDSTLSLSCPSIFRIIDPISPNDICAEDAISRMVLPSWWSLITSCSFSCLFNITCTCFYWNSLRIAFSVCYQLLPNVTDWL